MRRKKSFVVPVLSFLSLFLSSLLCLFTKLFYYLTGSLNVYLLHTYNNVDIVRESVQGNLTTFAGSHC